MAFVTHKFKLNQRSLDVIRGMTPKFGYNGFGEFIFYRTYSRVCCDICKSHFKVDRYGKDICPICKYDFEYGQESWADVVIRVTNGTFSIRKDWYVKNHITWDEGFWQDFAIKFAISMFLMEWTPPGRGLWAMGSDFVYERGSMALYNCAATDITTRNMDEDIGWLMDSLMHGVGVGFYPIRDDALRLKMPRGKMDYVIPDTREGWVISEQLIIRAYLHGEPLPRMIYDKVRGPGLPIRGFGGVSSGPKPLMELHERTIREFETYMTRPEYDSVYLKGNIPNHVGCCVVAGNVRRSAELMKGKVHDKTFMDLKNYDIYPERQSFGWMSNNSVELENDEDFMMLGEIAKRVIQNGEPGFLNRKNMPYGRIGKKMKGLKKDKADKFNPCGEIGLEHRETCNVDETYPTVCNDVGVWLENSCTYATVYCTTVSLLPTHQPSTNRIVAKNRRIGVSIVDVSGWMHDNGVHKVTKWMRQGYEKVVDVAKWCNNEAGVPLPIRHTTIKPGGTTPKIVGKTAGRGNPTFHETLRRVRVAKNSPVHPLLVEANIPYEEDKFDCYTDCFEYPILQGPAPPAYKVSLWEQAMNLVLVQREWADNAVSNTLYFKPKWPLIEKVDSDFRERLEYYIGVVSAGLVIDSTTKEFLVPERYKITIRRDSENRICEIKIHEYDSNHEEDYVEPVLSAIAPLTKSVTLLPHTPYGAYAQMPEEGITRAEYEERLSKIKPIDWSRLRGSDGQDEKYCNSEQCEMPK